MRIAKIREEYERQMKEIRSKLDALANDEGLDVDGDEFDRIQGKQLAFVLKKLSDRDVLRLSKIKEALDKIDNGTFGSCEECGAKIGERRLIALPGVSLCVQCAEQQEGFLANKHAK